MKTTQCYISGLSRFTACAVATLGLGVAASFAAPSVTLSLSGATFGIGKSVSIHSGTGVSAPKLSAAVNYSYKLVGTCHTTGDLDGVIPVGTSLSTLLNAKVRKGTYVNSTGMLPIEVLHRPISSTQTVSTPFGPFTATLSGKIDAGADANGVVFLHIKKFALDPALSADGAVVFESGSKLIISVVP